MPGGQALHAIELVSRFGERGTLVEGQQLPGDAYFTGQVAVKWSRRGAGAAVARVEWVRAEDIEGAVRAAQAARNNQSTDAQCEHAVDTVAVSDDDRDPEPADGLAPPSNNAQHLHAAIERLKAQVEELQLEARIRERDADTHAPDVPTIGEVLTLYYPPQGTRSRPARNCT